MLIDDFSDNCGNEKIVRKAWDTFDICREAFGFTRQDPTFDNLWYNEANQSVERIEMSVYDIETIGKFDIVFFFAKVYLSRKS